MPSNKDLKRVARSRMKKTGESYTTARTQVLTKKKRTVPRQAAEDLASLAGMSDSAVHKRTGLTWKEWAQQLDAVDAYKLAHRDIVSLVSKNYDISDWWGQMVTVSYERFRGLRDVGQRRGGGYDVNKSKTYRVPLAKLYKAFSTARTRQRWLGDVQMTVRKSTREKSMRIVWSDDTPVDVYFYAKGDEKSQVTVQHRKLASKADAAKMRAYWTERLGALDQVVRPS